MYVQGASCHLPHFMLLKPIKGTVTTDWMNTPSLDFPISSPQDSSVDSRCSTTAFTLPTASRWPKKGQHAMRRRGKAA